MMVDFEKCLSFLACPACQGDLAYAGQGQGFFACRRCDRKYPIMDQIPRFLEVDSRELGQAKEHWESSPNFQYEAQAPLYSREYYEEQDKWRREE
ncbi:MAG: hypothetical protein JRJ59_01985, partial [Deltaproteobacteria bacterium]|nr:hypothetical protein [Deltaproteobacteria bacterium]